MPFWGFFLGRVLNDMNNLEFFNSNNDSVNSEGDTKSDVLRKVDTNIWFFFGLSVLSLFLYFF